MGKRDRQAETRKPRTPYPSIYPSSYAGLRRSTANKGERIVPQTPIFLGLSDQERTVVTGLMAERKGFELTVRHSFTSTTAMEWLRDREQSNGMIRDLGGQSVPLV
jgi:hypothetical protein